MLRAFIITCLTLLPMMVVAQTLGDDGFGAAGSGSGNAVPELPPSMLLMGASAIAYAAGRIARRRRR